MTVPGRCDYQVVIMAPMSRENPDRHGFTTSPLDLYHFGRSWAVEQVDGTEAAIFIPTIPVGLSMAVVIWQFIEKHLSHRIDIKYAVSRI
jgi:hypothetical protein